MRNRFPCKSNEIRTNSNLTIFPPLSATPPCPPTMHAGIRDDRKGRPYAINRRGLDTPGGVSLQNSLLAFSRLQEHSAAVTVGRSACGRPYALNRRGWGRRSLRLGKTKNHPVSGVVFAACQKRAVIARRAKPDAPQGGFSCPFGAIHLLAIRTPKCCHFGRSASKTVRFWGTDCHGATPLAMTVLFQIEFFDSLKHLHLPVQMEVFDFIGVGEKNGVAQTRATPVFLAF